jgi:hypothetical protein
MPVQAIRQARSAPTLADILPTMLLLLTLRIEPALGVFILLCVALMGQVAPPAAAFDATVIQVSGDQIGASPNGPIAAASRLGDISVNLQVNPADIGQAQFTVRVAECGRAVTDGQVRIKLSMPEQPALGFVFVETSPSGGGYSGSGDVTQEGLWRADVFVRTRDDPDEFRDLPVIFIAGPEPFVLDGPMTDTRYGPAILRLHSLPDAAARLAVRLRAGLRVRYRRVGCPNWRRWWPPACQHWASALSIRSSRTPRLCKEARAPSGVRLGLAQRMAWMSSTRPSTSRQ